MSDLETKLAEARERYGGDVDFEIIRRSRKQGFDDCYPHPAHGWTCFHCGETFHAQGKARLHFGEKPHTHTDARIVAIVRNPTREQAEAINYETSKVVYGGQYSAEALGRAACTTILALANEAGEREHQGMSAEENNVTLLRCSGKDCYE
jgi:hypothetical protein